MDHSAFGSFNASPMRRRSHIARLAGIAIVALIASVLLPPGVSAAATAPGLGDAESFGVLGATTVTNTGPTVVYGDLGVYAGSAVTGFGPGIVNGEIHAGDTTAQSAQADAMTAYNALSTQPCTATLANPDLTGLTLTPGVYCFTSTAGLTGALTLDAEDDPAAVFIFRVASALTTGPNSSVGFTDGFETCNVFWQAGSSATLDTGTDFVGTVIALTESVIARTGATVDGRLISLGAAVTLDTNVITRPVCTVAATVPVVVPPSVTTTTTPATTTTDDAAVDQTTDDTTPIPTTPVDDTTEVTDATPSADGPIVPGLTASPAGPSSPSSPDSPSRPSLPYTGANLMPAIFAVLAVIIGGSMVMGARRIHVPSSAS